MRATANPAGRQLSAPKALGSTFNGDRLIAVFRFVTLTIVGLLFILPYILMVSASFKPLVEIFTYLTPLTWKTFIPQNFTWENFTALWNLKPISFSRFLGNSLFVSLTVTILTLLVCTPAAYAFARLKFPGAKLLFALCLVAAAVPFEAISVPLYLLIQELGWIDSLAALIIPWIPNAYAVFLLRQFILGIPVELEEAARIDGCSRLGILWRILLPNLLPGMVTVALIRFQASWDAFLWPLIAVSARENWVVQIAIANFATDIQVSWNLIFAAATLTTVPVLVLFAILERYYVAGIVSSGVKG